MLVGEPLLAIQTGDRCHQASQTIRLDMGKGGGKGGKGTEERNPDGTALAVKRVVPLKAEDGGPYQGPFPPLKEAAEPLKTIRWCVHGRRRTICSHNDCCGSALRRFSWQSSSTLT